jgi:hypothetical protein
MPLPHTQLEHILKLASFGGPSLEEHELLYVHEVVEFCLPGRNRLFS